MNRSRSFSQPDDLAEKGAFARIALDEMDLQSPLRSRNGKHETGKSGAGSEVEPSAGVRREVEKLERIDDMTIPDLVERGRANEVLDRLPAAKLALQQLKLLECFT